MTRRLAHIALVAGTALLAPAATHAQACDSYSACCMQLVGAYEAAGVGTTRLAQFEAACRLPDMFTNMAVVQDQFCIDAYRVLSINAHQDYRAGRIPFYPDTCLPMPLDDPGALPTPDFDASPYDPAIED